MLGLLVASSLLLLFGSGAQSQSCSSAKLTPALRKLIVTHHNNLRSTLAKGQAKTRGGGYAPYGKNIYKLTYDCALEAKAQQWADGCSFTHSAASYRNAGENLYWYIGGGGLNMSSALHIPQAINMWWGELAEYGIVDKQNIFTNAVYSTGVAHFTAMAWGSTTKIGCGFSNNCNRSGRQAVFVVCHYSKTGNIFGSKIYELGAPCTADSQCTTYPNSRCSVSEGLCYV